MNILIERQLPEYYPTMYLDGYTPQEIWIAFHNSMIKEEEEKEFQKAIHEGLEKTIGKAIDDIMKGLK